LETSLERVTPPETPLEQVSPKSQVSFDEKDS